VEGARRINSQMAGDQRNIYDHFTEIAPSYRHIRTTDLQPILCIREKLKDLRTVRAVDIGCGAGRYNLLLFRYLRNLHLTCIDINESMLKETSTYLRRSGIHPFTLVKANAHDLPLKGNLMDCVFSFNAIHHFDFLTFIEEVATITREGSFVFIYTRLQSQNERNIWGKHFPLFLEKEQRLYELKEITQAMKLTSCSTIDSIENFQFKRKATLDQLLNRVRKRHYSTFYLYDDQELEHCLKQFEREIINHFSDPEHIEWFDENIMIVLRTASKTAPFS
jgi:ubiquinone/menaquinone biosynthesis C-methylase UbiE